MEKKVDDSLATWKSKIDWYSENNHFKNMNRIDGMPTELEWKIFPAIIALGLFEQIQNLLTNLQCEPEHVKGRIIFMSMFNDIVWDAKGNKELVNTIHRQLRNMLANALAVSGLSWGLDQKKNGTEPVLKNKMDHGIEWHKK